MVGSVKKLLLWFVVNGTRVAPWKGLGPHHVIFLKITLGTVANLRCGDGIAVLISVCK